jgi:DNA-binding PadR family transcriptional regulator
MLTPPKNTVPVSTRRGDVEAVWGVTAQGRRARYYQLTRAGRRELAQQTSHWLRYADTVTDILTAKPRRA